MPCNAAMVEKLVSVSVDQEVEEVIDILRKYNIDLVPVVDKSGKLEGVFSTRILLRNLLPVAVTTGDAVHMDIKVGAAPGVAKRLKKVGPMKVGDLMDRKPKTVGPDTPIWEGVNLLVQGGEPLMVVENGGGKGRLLGMITQQSMIDELERIQNKTE